MGIKSRSPRATITGGAGAILSGIWSAYAIFTTAEGLPEDTEKMGRMLADPPIYMPYLMLAACVVILAWSLWPRDDEEPETTVGTTATATTSGPQSNAFAGNIFKGPVTFGHPLSDSAPASQPRRCPEMKLADALWIIRRVVSSDEDARRQLQQAFVDNRVHPWGRAEIPPTTYQSPVSAMDIWTEIKPDYWRDFRLGHAAFEPDRDQPQTEAREHVTRGLMNRYWSIRVDQREIEDAWPAEAVNSIPREVEHYFATGEDLVESKPDLPLPGLLVRVYAKHRLVPHGEALSQAYYRKIDLEIADTVALNNLHVWGRWRDRPLAPLSFDSWKRGKFSHRRKTVTVPTVDSNMIYTDLHFCIAEIDRHWPKD